MDREKANTVQEREGKCENVANTGKQKTENSKKQYSGQKLCQCMDCGKSFTRKSSLLVHQRIHTGEKLFMCSECGKRFGLKSSMVRHMKTHTPKTLKTCPDCGKSFSHYSSLFQHQKVHGRERLYKGPYREKSFTQSSQLSGHQRLYNRRTLPERVDWEQNVYNVDRIHTQKNVVCLECGKNFKEHRSLVRHQRIHEESTSTTTVSTARKDGFACDISFHVNENCNTSKSSVNLLERLNAGSFWAKKKTHEVEKRFLCIECGKSFTRKSSLIVHQRTHTGEKQFMCSECGKRFGLKSSMVRHMKTHSTAILSQQQKIHKKKKPYKCLQCEKSFSRALQLVAHERNHQAEVFYPKPEPAGPDLLNSEIDQVKDRNAEVSHVCHECGKCFRQKTTFIRHQRIHKGKFYLYNSQNGKNCSNSVNKADPEAPKQEYPGVTAKSSPGLDNSYMVSKFTDNTDSKTSKEAKGFLCMDCGKSFTRKSSLIVHQRTHTGEKLFMCTDCGKRFSLKSSLVRHMRTHSPKILNICSDCGKCFSRYSSLFQHQKVHRREKPFKCPYCEKSFYRASQLLFHQRTHKVEKSNPTSEAGEHIDDQGNLESSGYTISNIPHLGAETNCKSSEINLKKYKSQDIICNASSKVTKAVVKHECTIDKSICKSRLSSRGRAYHCIQCGKNFTRKSSLIVHQRIHTGEKLYTCTDCGKRFGFKSCLIRHLKTHTGQMFNVCSECGIYFSRYCDLLLHSENHMGQLQFTGNAASKLETGQEQSQVTMQQPVTAEKDDVTVPLMEQQDSGQEQKDQGPYITGEPLPIASPLKEFFDPHCKEKIQEGSQNIKQETSENLSTDGEPDKSQKDEDVCTHPCALYRQNELSKSFIEGCSGKTDETTNHPEQPILNVLNNHNLEGSDKITRRSRSTEKRFLCSECGKNFTRKSSLIVHQRTHTGEKLFMCTECGKRFGLKSSMVRHMRIHNTENFKCMACERNFRDYSRFLEHQRSHLGELPNTEPQLSVH